MATPEPGLREKILSTAKSLFIQYGFHALAMRQIAEALSVSKPALYYHFKNKEELFLAILNAYLDEMEAALDRIAAEPVTYRKKIRTFVEYVLGQPSDQRAIIRLASQEMGQLSAAARKSFDHIYRDKFVGKVEAILKAGMAGGELKPVRPDIATWALLGVIYPYLYPTQVGIVVLPEEMIQEITNIYLDGISK